MSELQVKREGSLKSKAKIGRSIFAHSIDSIDELTALPQSDESGNCSLSAINTYDDPKKIKRISFQTPTINSFPKGLERRRLSQTYSNSFPKALESKTSSSTQSPVPIPVRTRRGSSGFGDKLLPRNSFV